MHLNNYKKGFTPLEIVQKFLHYIHIKPKGGSAFNSKKFHKNSTVFLTGFTLLELLIVIAILAILATVVILVINPAEYLKQARDVKRLADISNINKAVNLFDFDNSGVLSSTSSTIVYVSIPDATSTCANLGLPTLPTGYSYHCSTTDNLNKINGTGWIPLDFARISGGSPISSLPIDPVNTTSTRNYYTYIQGGSFQLTASFESSSYKMGGEKDKTSTDKGSYADLYEMGTNLALLPIDYGDSSLVAYWTFDENTGTTAYDYSGNNRTVSIVGATWTTGKVGKALSFDGVGNYAYASNTGQFDLTTTNVVTVSYWLNWDTFSDNSMVAFEYGDYNSYTDGFTIFPNSPTTFGKFRTCLKGNVDYNCSNFSRPTAQTWHQYTVVYDKSQPGATEVIPYVDGSPVSYTKDYSGNNTNNFGFRFVYFMSRIAASNFAKGIMDDVKMYKRALTAAEVSAIYNSTK